MLMLTVTPKPKLYKVLKVKKNWSHKLKHATTYQLRLRK